MGVRYFCDRCKNEFKSNGLAIDMYTRDALGIKLMHMGKGLLCEECAKKFNMIKDRLENEDDFFNMTDKDISLMEYDFEVGDKVLTSTGQLGIIESFCDCDLCQGRGFCEPHVRTVSGVDSIWITNTDKRNGFADFYQIGKYKFGNIDKESVHSCIENEDDRIKEATENKAEYERQLKRLRAIESFDGEIVL